jgi:hypothetical protein
MSAASEVPMTAASGTDLPAANGSTHRARGAVSAVDPASSPTSEGVGEGRGPDILQRVHDRLITAIVDFAEVYAEEYWKAARPSHPAVSRTLAVAEQTVELARERQ